MYSARRGTSHVQELLVGHHRRPLAEERADVLEGVHVGDRVVVVRVLAELLHPAVEVAQDRVDVDDPLAVDLEHDPQHAVGRWVVRSDVDEHLAVAEGVELGLAFRPGRVGRDRLVYPELLVEHDPRVVRRGMAGDRGHRSRPPDRRVRGGVGRGVGLLHVTLAGAGRSGGVVGQEEVLAQGEAGVVGRHVDPAQIAVALEADAEHVVGLPLRPLGTLPQEGDRGHPGVVALDPVRDHPEPVGRRAAPEVVDDLHHLPGVHPAQVDQELEPELGLVVEGPNHLGQVGRGDPDLGLVVALADRPEERSGRSAIPGGA